MAQFVIEIKLDSNQDRNKDRKISIIVMGIRTRIMMINFFGKLGKFMPSSLYKMDLTIVVVVVVCHTWRPPVYCPLSRSRCLSSPRSRTACTGPSVRHTTNRYACKGILWVWHLWVCRSPQCGSYTIFCECSNNTGCIICHLHVQYKNGCHFLFDILYRTLFECLI